MKAILKLTLLGSVSAMILAACGDKGAPNSSENSDRRPNTQTPSESESLPPASDTNAEEVYTADFWDPISQKQMAARMDMHSQGTNVKTVWIDVLASQKQVPVRPSFVGIPNANRAMILDGNSHVKGCEIHIWAQSEIQRILEQGQSSLEDLRDLENARGINRDPLSKEAGYLKFTSKLYHLDSATEQAAKKALAENMTEKGATANLPYLEHAFTQIVEYEYKIKLKKINFSEYDKFHAWQRTPWGIAAKFRRGQPVSNGFVCDLVHNNMEISVLRADGTELPLVFEELE